ncbi:hypothetical protein Dimus_035111 [Dionaea muscipula]
MPKISTGIRGEDYAHSPVHYALVVGDHLTLIRLLSSLPKLADPSVIHSESDSLAQELIADQISALLDRRDVPFGETPLHLAIRLNDLSSAKSLASAGADISLQNSDGWSALQEALCRRSSDIALVLVQHHHLASWSKWRRRLPRLVAVLRRMRDFYMEISFHFESSIVPFVGKIAPSDTYKIWKRDGNLRADTSLAGFEGLKIQRADQSFLFLGDGDRRNDVPEGSMLVLNHDERKIFDAFENAGAPMTDADVAGFCSQSSVYRPGMDVTKAELVSRTNWRRQEKTEMVGEWRSKVCEVQNVSFSFRSRKVPNSDKDVDGSEQISPLELDEETEEGFLVAESPNFGVAGDRRHSSYVGEGRRHSSFVRSEREWVSVSRKSVDINLTSDRRRIAAAASSRTALAPALPLREKEYVKSLQPVVWLTEQFPLKTEELLPLLDILSNKVKAVRRMKELLTTKFPPGSFPVKIAIPVVPTVKVVITFTKFTELQPTELFYTSISSPKHLNNNGYGEKAESHCKQCSSSSTWLWRSSGRCSAEHHHHHHHHQSSKTSRSDPFVIPSGYTWTSIDSMDNHKLKKSRSVMKSK